MIRTHLCWIRSFPDWRRAENRLRRNVPADDAEEGNGRKAKDARSATAAAAKDAKEAVVMVVTVAADPADTAAGIIRAAETGGIRSRKVAESRERRRTERSGSGTARIVRNGTVTVKADAVKEAGKPAEKAVTAGAERQVRISRESRISRTRTASQTSRIRRVSQRSRGQAADITAEDTTVPGSPKEAVRSRMRQGACPSGRL